MHAGAEGAEQSSVERSPGEWVWLSPSGAIVGVSTDAVRGRTQHGGRESANGRTGDKPPSDVPADGGYWMRQETETGGVVPTSSGSVTKAQGDPNGPAVVELVRLVGRLQELNSSLAWQVGCLQAQLQHAQEKSRVLERPQQGPTELEKRTPGRQAAESTAAECTANHGPSPWRRFWRGLAGA